MIIDKFIDTGGCACHARVRLKKIGYKKSTLGMDTELWWDTEVGVAFHRLKEVIGPGPWENGDESEAPVQLEEPMPVKQEHWQVMGFRVKRYGIDSWITREQFKIWQPDLEKATGKKVRILFGLFGII